MLFIRKLVRPVISEVGDCRIALYPEDEVAVCQGREVEVEKLISTHFERSRSS